MDNNKQHLKLTEKISYGFGDLASVLYWQTFMLYFTYFYTDVFLIPASAAATMFLVSRLWDGVNDPMMGILADRTETKWGKFRPYLLWLCVPFAIVGVLTFTVPNFGMAGKMVWAYVTFILIMMLYTAINIPYTALMGVISPNSNERTSVSSIKFIFAYGAGIIVSATLLPMVKFFGGGESIAPRGWTMSFIIYGIAAVIFFLIAFKGTKERVHPPKSQKTSVVKDLKELVTNGPWLILLAGTITFILFVATRGSVTAHYFKYVIGEQKVAILGGKTYSFEALVSAFNTIGQISSLLGVFLINYLAGKFGKKTVFLYTFAVAILSTAVFFVLQPNQLGLIYFMQIIGSMSGGPLSVLLWAMYADTADYAEWKNGCRATGLVFSASTMSQKFGWAFGAFVALNLMSSVGFTPNQAQTADSLKGLIALFSIIPAVFGIISAIIIFFYPLNDKRVEEIGAELAERRKLDEATA